MNYTLIVLFSEKMDRVLLLHRNKEPYKGKFNGFGGKVEAGESILGAAYRELYEETTLEKEQLVGKRLNYVMNIQFNDNDITTLSCFYGIIKEEFEKVPPREINEGTTVWVYSRIARKNISYIYAGEGNLNYLINYILEANGKHEK